MNKFIEPYLPFLESVIELWPKKNEPNSSTYLKAIANMVSEDFDKLDLVVGFTGCRDPRVVESTLNLVVIDFEDDKYYPYRAKVVKKNEELFLESLKFQCPVCFGSGINEESECTICEGVGWGAG